MIIDGTALAAKRLEELKKQRAQFGALTLALVVGTDDKVTESFIKIKKRAAAALDIAVVDYASLDQVGNVDGVILQLPLQAGVDVDEERNKIPLALDVDILSDAAYAQFVAGTFPAPPVPRALLYVLEQNNIDARGKKVVVVGQGKLVGKPAAELFKKKGAEVTVLARGDDIASHTLDADIIILGAGDPHLLTPDMIREGAIVLDAGTSESSGKVVGDADPACADKCLLFTPTPGGIGPIAVVEIFANLLELLLLDKQV